MVRYHTSPRVVAVAFVTALVIGATAAAQTAWKQGRTPDGQPDIQGIWLNFDNTPFEAPAPQAPAPAAPTAAAPRVNPAPEFADHNHKVSARRTAMVVGNERTGLTPDLLELVDDVVEIPVWGLPYSYNAASAATMALYEYCRQWPSG